MILLNRDGYVTECWRIRIGRKDKRTFVKDSGRRMPALSANITDKDSFLKQNTQWKKRRPSRHSRPHLRTFVVTCWAFINLHFLDNAYVRAMKSFVIADNPFTKSGRSQAKKIILSSGPAYANPSLHRAPKLSEYSGRHTGWRMGIRLSMIAVGACFAVEFILLVVALVFNKPKDGLGILHTGDCETVKNLTILLMLPLNLVGTVVISTSNYVMQCISAPSREEVDEVHEKGGFLDIGLSSLHNLHFGNPRKSLFWCILAITTVPIHLLLNSAVFGSLQANNYGVLVVSDDFDQNQSWTQYCSTNGNKTLAGNFACSLQADVAAMPSGNITKLTAQECIRQYGNEFQSNASNVMLVTGTSHGNWPSLSSPAELWSNRPLTMTWNQDPFEGHNNSFSNANDSSGGGFTETGLNSPPPTLSLVFNNATGDVNLTNSCDGNAVPGFEQYSSATSGLFIESNCTLWQIDSLRTVFDAFDYRFWMIAQAVYYNLSSPSMTSAKQWDPITWICEHDYVISGKACSRELVLSNATHWTITPEAYETNHCYVMPTKEQCNLHYSMTILVTVMLCDLFKLVIMFLILRIPGEPLVTLGDAIASFMTKPDGTTIGRCLVDEVEARKNDAEYRKEAQKDAAKYGIGPGLASPRFDFCCVPVPNFYKSEVEVAQLMFKRSKVLGPKNKVWHDSKRRWLPVPTFSRWISLAALYLALLASTAGVFVIGIRDLSARGMTSIWDHGFSGPNPNSIFSAFAGDGASNALFEVIIINLPQLLFSIWYFMFNDMFTTILAAEEWSHFVKSPKGLRVSNPKMAQRATYWLQLPWRYSIPLVVFSSVLHWLVGRSLFLVKIDVYGWDGAHETWRDISACGYSPLAMLLVMILLALLPTVLIGFGLRELQPGMPVTGTASTAFSAACHPLSDDQDAAYEPLMWGVVKEPTEAATETPTHTIRRKPVPVAHVIIANRDDGEDGSMTAALLPAEEVVIPLTEATASIGRNNAKRGSRVLNWAGKKKWWWPKKVTQSSIEDRRIYEPGHCCFTTKKVHLPEDGKPYM